ncbi:MAG: hypothetical protein AAGB07_18100, partial [Pseudomonadota bacterium]
MGAKLVFLGHCQTVRLHNAFAAHVDQLFEDFAVEFRMRLDREDAIVVEQRGVLTKRVGSYDFGAFRRFNDLILMPGQKTHLIAADVIICVAHGPALIEF